MNLIEQIEKERQDTIKLVIFEFIDLCSELFEDYLSNKGNIPNSFGLEKLGKFMSKINTVYTYSLGYDTKQKIIPRFLNKYIFDLKNNKYNSREQVISLIENFLEKTSFN
jgi:hypothetical protein